MRHIRSIVECAPDARLDPGRRAMLEPSGRQSDIDLLRSVIVVGIAHIRRHQGHTDQKVATALKTRGPYDHRVGMALRPNLARKRAARRTVGPVQTRLYRGEAVGKL